MSGATIITLGPSDNSSMQPTKRVAATFEEAFGEFSEARGKGRARRKKRKLERVTNRREVRKAKTEAKREKRMDKVAAKDDIRSSRQEKRQGRRAGRGERRLSRREEEMTKRQGIKTKRKGLVQERKAMGEEEEEETTSTTPTSDSSSSDSSSSDQGSSDQGSSDSSSSDQGSSDQGSSDQGYDDQGSSDEGYGDEGSSDEGYGDEGYGDDSDSGNYDDETEMGDYSAEDSGNFDGVTKEESFNEMNDNAIKKINVNPSLLDLCNKIEWNKELISRLEEKRKMGIANPSEVSKQIIERKKRLAALQGDLDLYLGFGAEFSSADGMLTPSARKSRPTKEQIGKRHTEVQSAKMKATRMKTYGLQDKMNTRKRTKNGGDVTPVDVELQPSFQKGRIVVPPTGSNFDSFDFADGKGDAFDYADGPGNSFDFADGGQDLPMRESYSPTMGDAFDFADGKGDAFDYADGTTSTSKINWLGVLVGVAVGATAIWAIRKYKLLDK